VPLLRSAFFDADEERVSFLVDWHFAECVWRVPQAGLHNDIQLGFASCSSALDHDFLSQCWTASHRVSRLGIAVTLVEDQVLLKRYKDGLYRELHD
jgi:hypothetical protein